MKHKRYFITGFMAAGKSRLGEKLAELAGMPYQDLDTCIENECGATIPELFEQKGESYFRKQEYACLFRLADSFQGVISLGGGALHNINMVEEVKEKGLLLFIDTPFYVILERLYKDKGRPLLRDEKGNIKSKRQIENDLGELYRARRPLYQRADVIFKPKREVSVSKNGVELYKTIVAYESKN